MRIEWQKEIGELLQEPNRRSLLLTCVDFECDDMIFLVEQLNQHPNVTVVDLSRGNLENDSAIELAKLKHVTDLNVCNNAIRAPGAIALLQNTHFKKLILSQNGLDDSILQAAINNHTLKEFKVERAYLEPEVKQQIDDHFKQRSSLLSNGHFKESSKSKGIVAPKSFNNGENKHKPSAFFPEGNKVEITTKHQPTSFEAN